MLCEEGYLRIVAGAVSGGARRDSVQSESMGEVGSCRVLRSSLLLAPGPRGYSVSFRRIGECIEFVESCGYRKLFKRFQGPDEGKNCKSGRELHTHAIERLNGVPGGS